MAISINVPSLGMKSYPDPIPTMQNFHYVDVNLKVLISDDDLSTISQLKIHSIIQEAFKKFKIVDYKVDSSETFYRKFIYLDLSGLCYVYEKDGKLFEKIEKETIFKEAEILKIGDEDYIKTLAGIFKLFEFNEENYYKLKQIHDDTQAKLWEPTECYDGYFKKFVPIKPLID